MKYPSKIVAASVAVSLAAFVPAVPAGADETADHEVVQAEVYEAEQTAGKVADDAASEVAADAAAIGTAGDAANETAADAADDAADAAAGVADDAAAYNKADFYSDGGQWEESSSETSFFSARAAYTVYPMYLSDEMKYFAKYESSCNYDQGFSRGDGYHALGFYQFDHRYGLKEFVLACYAYNPSKYSMFKQFSSVSDYEFKREDAIRRNGRFTDLGTKLNAAWHAAYAADPSEFAALQDGWAYQSYYLPAESYLKSRGIDISNRADCVKGLCWGMSNLFGTMGWRKFVGGVSDGYDWNGVYHYLSENYNWPGCGLNNSMTDREFVTTLCNYVVNNVAVFYKGQPMYHQGWQNRYRNELKDCLSYLGSEQKPGSNSTQKGTWVQVGTEWKYSVGGTYVTNGWRLIDKVWYWFDGSGIAARNTLKTIDGVLYRFDASCGMIVNSWYGKGEDWYYFTSSGAAASGWQLVDGEWYYLDAKSHLMLTGLQKISGDYYYLNPEHDGTFGAMRTGWRQVNGAKRYFDESGVMRTGWFVESGNKYYLASDGAVSKGWILVSGSWYYADDSGVVQTGMLRPDGSTLYFFDESGVMQTGWVFEEFNWYYFADWGGAASVWQYVDGLWYYLDPRTHAMRSGLCEIGGDTYYLNLEHDGTFGAMQTGWKWMGNCWRYFRSSGAMELGWYAEGDTWYFLGSDGVMRRWWQLIDGTWYYFNGSGAMQANCWQGDYYLTSDGSMATNTRIDGYYVGADGKWIPGK